jgi:hypothetical protein
LLAKLHYYGIQGRVANWFRTWHKTKNWNKIIWEILLKMGTVKHGMDLCFS